MTRRRHGSEFPAWWCEPQVIYLFLVPVLRLFAAAREAAAVSSVHLEGNTVGEILAAASSRFGGGFEDVLGVSRVWVNGEPAGDADAVSEDDEIAVIPPVSGGDA